MTPTGANGAVDAAEARSNRPSEPLASAKHPRNTLRRLGRLSRWRPRFNFLWNTVVFQPTDLQTPPTAPLEEVDAVTRFSSALQSSSSVGSFGRGRGCSEALVDGTILFSIGRGGGWHRARAPKRASTATCATNSATKPKAGYVWRALFFCVKRLSPRGADKTLLTTPPTISAARARSEAGGFHVLSENACGFWEWEVRRDRWIGPLQFQSVQSLVQEWPLRRTYRNRQPRRHDSNGRKLHRCDDG